MGRVSESELIEESLFRPARRTGATRLLESSWGAWMVNATRQDRDESAMRRRTEQAIEREMLKRPPVMHFPRTLPWLLEVLR